MEGMEPVTSYVKHAPVDVHNTEHPQSIPQSDGELPLLDLFPYFAIAGMPPFKQQSKYTHDAEKMLLEYAERWNIVSFDSYLALGLQPCSYFCSGTVSLDRLVAISKLCAIMFVLDDLFIDCPQDDFLLDQYGIDRSHLDSPRQMLEYFDMLYEAFSQKYEPDPISAAPIERIQWELGRDLLRLSNPDWFSAYVDGLLEFLGTSVASRVDIAAGVVQDLEWYSVIRCENFGGKFVQMTTEVARDFYLPKELSSHPIYKELTHAATLYMAFVNDIYSYYRETREEGNPRNLICVLMKSQRKSLVQSVMTAVELINCNARVVLDLDLATSNSTLQKYFQGIKEELADSASFFSTHERYQQPELRDVIE